MTNPIEVPTLPNFNLYKHFEFEPCREDEDGVERCSPDQATMWVIYGRRKHNDLAESLASHRLAKHARHLLQRWVKLSLLPVVSEHWMHPDPIQIPPTNAYQCGHVEMDDSEVFPCYFNDYRWNGFIQPYFDLETVPSVVQYLKDSKGMGDETDTEYAEGEAVFYTDRFNDPEHTSRWPVQEIEVEGEMIKAISIGDSWCWGESKPDEPKSPYRRDVVVLDGIQYGAWVHNTQGVVYLERDQVSRLALLVSNDFQFAMLDTRVYYNIIVDGEPTHEVYMEHGTLINTPAGEKLCWSFHSHFKFEQQSEVEITTDFPHCAHFHEDSVTPWIPRSGNGVAPWYTMKSKCCDGTITCYGTTSLFKLKDDGGLLYRSKGTFDFNSPDEIRVQCDQCEKVIEWGDWNWGKAVNEGDRL